MYGSRGERKGVSASPPGSGRRGGEWDMCSLSYSIYSPLTMECQLFEIHIPLAKAKCVTRRKNVKSKVCDTEAKCWDIC